MEQLIILIAVGIIALVKWVVEKAQQSGEHRDETDSASPNHPGRALGPEQSEEQRMRKFMEALGIPTDSAPPPPIRRRPVPQPPPLIVETPAPQPLPRRPVLEAEPVPEFETVQREPMPPTPSRRRPARARPIVPPAPAPVFTEPVPPSALIPFVEPEFPATSETRSVRAGDLRSLLGSPESVRTAILVREILGPPRGLQSTFEPRGVQ